MLYHPAVKAWFAQGKLDTGSGSFSVVLAALRRASGMQVKVAFDHCAKERRLALLAEIAELDYAVQRVQSAWMQRKKDGR